MTYSQTCCVNWVGIQDTRYARTWPRANTVVRHRTDHGQRVGIMSPIGASAGPGTVVVLLEAVGPGPQKMNTLNFKTALRSLRRGGTTTAINISGLAIGIAACLLILLYVENELRYDHHHEHADSVFRITEEELDEAGDPGIHRVLIDPPVAHVLSDNIPEVVAAARLTPVGPALSNGDSYVDSGHCYWADPTIFDIFSLPLVAGDAPSALVEPFSLVLSRDKAMALFGDADPLGQAVLVNNTESFTVTGVFDELPGSTHLPIDVLGSMATMSQWFGDLSWGSPNYATYVRLADDADPSVVAAKINPIVGAHRPPERASASRFFLQPLTDIHLRSHLVGELAPNADIRYIYLFACVAGFILLIACINFTNLATARASRRAREVGMRKTLGANRSSLIRQFLGESTVVALVATATAVLLVELSLPAFNGFTGKSLSLLSSSPAQRALVLIAFGCLVGFVAGSYPAFVLSAFRPATVLKGSVGSRAGGARLRAALVVTQFTIAIALLIGTLVVQRQLSFMQHRDLGYNQEHVLVTPTVWDLREDFDPLRNELLRHPDIINVAQSNPIPSGRLSFSIDVEAHELTAQEAGDQHARAATAYPVFVDDQFFPTYEIDLVAGRNFSDERASDTDTGFILNGAAVEALGWADARDAINKPLRAGGWRGTVIGVVEDFHLESLHQRIAPMVFYMDARNFRMVSARLRAGADIPAVVAFMERHWQRYEPNAPLSYSFLDERFEAVYATERRLGQIIGLFALLAIAVTALGVFGMAAFTVERRRKEISIRKVLGASASGIVVLFSRDYAKLVVVGLAIGGFIALVGLRRWLDAFAYHTSVAWWVFPAAGFAALTVALITVGVQAGRAARLDPVKNLRYE